MIDSTPTLFPQPLSPTMPNVSQITEALHLRRALNGTSTQERAIELLRLVGMPNPEKRVKEYPHQFSGGMRQRVMIAMALSREPRPLIADEVVASGQQTQA